MATGLNERSQSVHALPSPKPVPSQTGNALPTTKHQNGFSSPSKSFPLTSEQNHTEQNTASESQTGLDDRIADTEIGL